MLQQLLNQVGTARSQLGHEVEWPAPHLRHVMGAVAHHVDPAAADLQSHSSGDGGGARAVGAVA
eukprot:4440196-Heterocapsa_arctica.AAC.1